MSKKEVKIYTFVNGVQVIGQVETDNSKTLRLVQPCIMYFREEGLVLSLLLDPSITEEREATFKSSNVMIEGVKANQALLEHYMSYIQGTVAPEQE